MTKLVFANEVRGETAKETAIRDGLNLHFWLEEEMRHLLSAAWRVVYMLGRASRFVEVVRVRFEHITGGGVVRPYKGVTDIAFEAVFVNPGSETKETKIVIRFSPFQFSDPKSVQQVSHCVLGAIYNHLKFACVHAEEAVVEARRAIGHLAQYE